MLTNRTAYNYEAPYKDLFVITKYFTNSTEKLQNGVTQIMYNIRRIKPYKSDTKVYLKVCLIMPAYKEPVIYFCLK